MSSSDDSGQQATIQDLFRVVTAMRAENSEFRAEVKSDITNLREELKADIKALDEKMTEQFIATNLDISKLPDFEMVAGIEGSQAEMKSDLKALRSEVHQVRGEVGKLASRINRSGIIPAE